VERARYDYSKTVRLAELRRQANLNQDQAAEHLGLTGTKRRDSVSKYELGISRPGPARRTRFILYLLDILGLRDNPSEFEELWEEVMVCEWGWWPLTDEERQRHLTPSAPATYSGSTAVAPAELGRAEPTPAFDSTRTGLPKKIFVCYTQHAEPDRSLAFHLSRQLAKMGHTVFLDIRLRVGEEWLETLDQEIKESDFMVVLLSQKSADSEMVRAEVRRAFEYQRLRGHPQTLPIRVSYEGLLPLAIDAYVNPLQYLVWNDVADNDRVCHEIRAAIEGRLASQVPVTAARVGGQLTVVDDGRVVTDESTIAPPLPEYDPRFLEELDAPGGPVKLSDRFYVERRGDAVAKRQVLRPGSLTYIRAPRQTGKSSLLIRSIRHARDRQRATIFVDFQFIDAAHLTDLDAFLRCLTDLMGRELRTSGSEEVWQTSLAATIKISTYLEARVLRSSSTPVLIAMDEVDRLYGTSFRNDFFGLLRAWHNKSQWDETWRKLSIIMALSTEPYLLIDDVYQSPFNVGTRVELEDFSEAQVIDLNGRHGSPLSDSEVVEMATLLGGQPYLTRKALYTSAAEGAPWSETVNHATDQQSPFSDHLRRYLWLVRDKPELTKAVKQVLQGALRPDEPAAQRLEWAGLIRRHGDNCLFRCPLYQSFFDRYLR
jgi:transcriptional regulator with XRE-family HTH domain